MTTLVAASHHGTLASGYVTWRSHFVLDSPRMGDAIVFVASIPAARSIVVSEGSGELIRDARGDVVGFRATGSGASNIVLEVVEARPTDRASVPIGAGDVVQRITVDGAGDPVLDVDPALGIVRHVGFAAAGDVSDQARARCDQLLASQGDAQRRDATYVRGIGGIGARGFAAHFTTRSERGRPAEIAALALFVAVVVVLVWLARRLQRDARVERAEQEVEAAFRDLG